MSNVFDKPEIDDGIFEPVVPESVVIGHVVAEPARRGRPHKATTVPRTRKLSDEVADEIDHDELRRKAEAKVRAKKKKDLEAELLAKYEREIEQELNTDPNEEMRDIMIDVPGNSSPIRIDREQFWHGRVYTVKASVADYLLAQMETCWRHEDEIGGTNRSDYIRPSGTISKHVNGGSRRGGPTILKTGISMGAGF